MKDIKFQRRKYSSVFYLLNSYGMILSMYFERNVCTPQIRFPELLLENKKATFLKLKTAMFIKYPNINLLKHTQQYISPKI